MTCVKLAELLLSLLLLKQVYGQMPETLFIEKGTNVPMGVCFGADYLVVYRFAPDGQQLLGNFSDTNFPKTLPKDLQGRIHMEEDESVLGMLIKGPTELDSGIYRTECWQNQTIVKNHTVQVFVCNEETSPKEIDENNDGGAEIRCESTSVGLEGTFVRWYQELHPESTLILDSSLSLELLIEDMQDYVEVGENGALLRLKKNVLQTFPQFYCAVFKGKTCLGFQNLYIPELRESKDVFASKGERVVLNCKGDGKDLQWETPLGQPMNNSSPSDSQMYISADKEQESLSLIIPVISDEHSGTYRCVSGSSEIEYTLLICPKSTLLEKNVSGGEDVSIECISGLDNSTRVQWYRQVQAELYEVIGDTYEDSISIPNDLRGRVELSYSGRLTIFKLNKNDERMYRCVVLNEFVDNQLTEDYDEEGTFDYDYIYNESIPDHVNISHCLHKQEFHLNIRLTKTVRNQTDEPEKSSNVTGLAVAGGLVGLVAVVALVIVLKKKLFTKNRNSDHVEQNRADPGCTERLHEAERQV